EHSSRVLASGYVLACGKCDSCVQILKKIHPDVYYIASEGKKISIERIRNLTRMFSQEPLAGKYKVAIVEDAHNVTTAAANSFLKFLEEAPKNTVIILTSSSFYTILETVRSRCQILRFSLPPKAELITFLKDKFGIRTKEAMDILYLSNGRPGLAIEFYKNQNSLEEYKQTMNTFISCFLNNDFEAWFALVPFMLNSKINTLAVLLGLIQSLIHIKLGVEPKTESGYTKAESLAHYTSKQLMNMAYRVLETQQYLRYNVNTKMALENLMIHMSYV
ncbi:hypothetical protein MYX07_05370, partial [Patescibacteria group bacterium AH-259-L07]|nr:hypothetical protein [Patescibacteria group bacterium AH-259-L07]